MTVGEVSDAFRQAGHDRAAERHEAPRPEDRFIDLYVAPVSVPSIGLSLLGERGFERLQERLKPGQHAIVVAGEGAYSFKGSGYVRGGIFDRIELLQGMPILPRKKLEHRGHTLEEFDLDAALQQRPDLLLVDELAHTNVPGSRHAKRYQDVLELLDAGIDVCTTLNVQHIESQVDTVRQISGVNIHSAKAVAASGTRRRSGTVQVG